MDLFSVLVGALTALLGGVIAAAAVLRRWQRRGVIDTNLEMGLLRYTRDTRHIKPEWPGNHDNLPDALDDVYDRLQRLEKQARGR